MRGVPRILFLRDVPVKLEVLSFFEDKMRPDTPLSSLNSGKRSGIVDGDKL